VVGCAPALLAGRRRLGRYWLLALLGLVCIALASGLSHATGLVEQVGPLTIMQVHVGAAVLALLVLVAHYRLHPVRPGAPTWTGAPCSGPRRWPPGRPPGSACGLPVWALAISAPG
jgi:hypothetical protein